ncbi:MAG: hypothetical protein STHCBS139747_000743 [Sporothrix thermara]
MPVPPRPPFSALPLDPNGPAGNAWGLYPDEDDALGALNMLTPEVVAAAAASQIRSGVRVSLDWPLNKPYFPSFGRNAFQHTLESRLRTTDESEDQRVVNDDALVFNTQCSSQWDGFRHYGYQKAKVFYNNKTQEEVESSDVLGIDAWVAHGGIVGRGVLLDYAGYAERHGIKLSHFSCTGIPVEHLQDLVREQGITFEPGDIVLIRIGFTVAYDALTREEQKALPLREVPAFMGLSPTKTTLQWLWETNCAALASDAVGMEQTPVYGDHVRPGAAWKGEVWEEEMQGGGLVHQWVLAGWGVPIGEMFDLEALRAQCVAHNRWTFFFASVPLRVPGGVASPPNAIAIF